MRDPSCISFTLVGHGQQRGVVRGGQDADALVPDHLLEESEYRAGVRGVELSGGLVGKDEGRPVHNSARDGHSLLLAA